MNTQLFKKACLVFGSVLLLAGFATAQGTTFGVRAGVNFQNINGKDAFGDKLENDLATRFHIGVQANIPIAPEFYFQPGLLFSTKGAKTETTIGEQTFNTDLNIAYVELPLNFLYKPVLGNGHLLLGVGPYVAYGVGGKYKGHGNNDSRDLKFSNEVTLLQAAQDTYVKPLDAGANLFVGYEFASGLFFQLNTQLGLLNINPEFQGVPDNDSSFQNTGFGFSAGYTF